VLEGKVAIVTGGGKGIGRHGDTTRLRQLSGALRTGTSALDLPIS